MNSALAEFNFSRLDDIHLSISTTHASRRRAAMLVYRRHKHGCRFHGWRQSRWRLHNTGRTTMVLKRILCWKPHRRLRRVDWMLAEAMIWVRSNLSEINWATAELVHWRGMIPQDVAVVWSYCRQCRMQRWWGRPTDVAALRAAHQRRRRRQRWLSWAPFQLSDLGGRLAEQVASYRIRRDALAYLLSHDPLDAFWDTKCHVRDRIVEDRRRAIAICQLCSVT